MAAHRQSHVGNGRGQQGGETTTTRYVEVCRLQQALIDGLKSATRKGEVFLMSLIGSALGGLARTRVIEDTELDPNNALAEDQEVAVLLCEAVYIFERDCAQTHSPDPVMTRIWNKTRGEDLAEIVIKSGLNYLVNPRSFGVRHLGQTPYRYFHSHLKEALSEKAKVRLQHGDIRAEAIAWQSGARA
ncbi:hypothetical protein E1B28_001958 [Marasmius oreades]|uniref:Uncharacterized protein n=1 Tax=Marasmius oreades TaxID=181124 RepID=A0A9P8AFQ7_9AGAR|nr:uncharacterized protein E1B28_001958 [Marasmius oreades]KAG7100181.1 hypothetical protein E1B28_001958 [Marasmius oreades]